MYKKIFPRIFLIALIVTLLSSISYADEPTLPTEGKSNSVAQVAPILGQDLKTAIPGQYIVVFKKDVSQKDVSNTITSLTRNRSASVSYTYDSALNGFAGRLTDDALKALQKNPQVAFIEADQIVSVNVTWGLDRIDQQNLPLNNSYSPAYPNLGSGVHAYIIDTGIRSTHNEFSGRVGSGYDAVDGGAPDDCNGHGTHVAGTVGGTTYGVARNVTLHGVRVLDCNGSGTNSGVIAGVNWVTNNHTSPAVANMSLGGGASTALDNAVNNSINSGVTYAIAGGNDNANACNYSPARVSNAITVGSTTSSDARSSFSNYGSCLDIFAPGSSITSAWYNSNSATNTISGTSMATPHVAGAAALYLSQNPGASPSQVTAALTGNATQNVISSVGSGSPNLLLYVGSGSGGGNPGAPCTGCDQYSGSLSGTGDYDYQPNGTYYYSGSGTHKAWLEGPSSADFDLYLWKWNGSSWSTVASSLSSSSSETITYNGSSGYYVWRVYSYSGGGSYDIWLDTP